MTKRLSVSFSGGETSAFMAFLVKFHNILEYDDVVYIFANTGQEDERTLEFVHACDVYMNLGVVWVEARVHHGQRKGSTHKVVDFMTASRNGEPFSEVIEKYGIPNQAYPHCTRELKLKPMRSYLKSIGWRKGTYDTAVGIRADEIDRISKDAEKERLVYPLISKHEVTKRDVNTFWKNQPFRLELKGYEGNCSWCWKKSNRKLYTLMLERPGIFNFPLLMETTKGLKGHNVDGTHRVFFRSNRSTVDIMNEVSALPGTFEKATDDNTIYNEELDAAGGCGGESCEVF